LACINDSLWFSTDEVVLFYEVIRQLRLDPSQTSLTFQERLHNAHNDSYLRVVGAERVIGLAGNLSPSDFAFAHVQGVFTLMRAIALVLYIVAIAIALICFDVPQRNDRVRGNIPIRVAAHPRHYSYFARTESLGWSYLSPPFGSCCIRSREDRRKPTVGPAFSAVLAMAARYHFALSALPVIAAIYFLRDRRNVEPGTPYRTHRLIFWTAGHSGQYS